MTTGEALPIDLGLGVRAYLMRDGAGVVTHVTIARVGTWQAVVPIRGRAPPNPGGHSWDLVAEEPLELHPSLHLEGIAHGWVKAGAWSDVGDYPVEPPVTS